MSLEDFTRMIESLRLTGLFGGTDPLTGKDADAVCTDGLDAVAEQEFLASLAYLELAQRAATKAVLLQARALAQSP